MADLHLLERRSQERIQLATVVTATTDQHTIAASMKNISPQGLFFFTDVFFDLGSDIDVLAVLPHGVGLPFGGMVTCSGRVVRVCESSGQYGVAVEIDHVVCMPVGLRGTWSYHHHRQSRQIQP